MLCLVAGIAQALETHQVLVACLFIELPDFMAVHPAFTSANLAVIASFAIYRTANAVPLATRQQVGQASTP